MNSAEKLLVDRLTSAFSSRTFRWLRVREMFLRKETYGFSCLLWTSAPVNRGGNSLELTPVLGVRHDVVDNLVNRLGLIYGEDNRKYTTTVARGLGFFPFTEGVEYRQYIRLDAMDDDVGRVTASVITMLDEHGDQFYQRYSSLLDCSRGLNDRINVSTHPLCNNFPRRAYYGVAAALFSESDRVPELVSQYLDFAKISTPKQYDEVAKRLDQILSIASSEQ
jgi:hypothetical protein